MYNEEEADGMRHSGLVPTKEERIGYAISDSKDAEIARLRHPRAPRFKRETER